MSRYQYRVEPQNDGTGRFLVRVSGPFLFGFTEWDFPSRDEAHCYGFGAILMHMAWEADPSAKDILHIGEETTIYRSRH